MYFRSDFNVSFFKVLESRAQQMTALTFVPCLCLSITSFPLH